MVTSRRRGGLVGDDEVGPAHEGHGDHDALAQAARELMRVLAQPLAGRRDADLLEEQHRPFACGGPGAALVAQVALGELVPDGVGGVQRRHRLLENHGHAVAAHRLDAPPLREVLAVEGQAPRAARGGPRQQVHDRQSRHRFAAAGLADEAQRLTAAHRERKVAHGVERAARRGDVDGQAFDLEDRSRRHVRPSGASASRRPSPARLMPKTRTASAVPGMAMSQNEKNM
jgi:hypothetical protein